MKVKNVILILSCCAIFTGSCVEDSNIKLPYEEKIMVLGYLLDVDNHVDGSYDYSFIQVYKSNPVTSEKDNALLRDIDFKLYAHNRSTDKTDIFTYEVKEFKGKEGYYSKVKVALNTEYQLEFTYDGQIYQSKYLTADITDVIFETKEIDPIDGTRYFNVDLYEKDGVINSYFMSKQDSIFSIFEAMDKFDYENKKFRFSSTLRDGYSIIKNEKSYYYCVEVSDYLEEYFEQWDLLSQASVDDFLFQLTGVPPSNLSSYFTLKDKSQKPKHYFFGAFAPMNSNIVKNF